MNKLLITLSFLISLICISSQSWALPPCPSDKNAYWHNCFGTYEMTDGSIYIGDHIKDLEAGINAGTNVIACYFGYSIKPSDHNKDILGANHPNELYGLISQI